MFGEKLTGADPEEPVTVKFSDDDGKSNKLIQYYRQKFAKKQGIKLNNFMGKSQMSGYQTNRSKVNVQK